MEIFRQIILSNGEKVCILDIKLIGTHFQAKSEKDSEKNRLKKSFIRYPLWAPIFEIDLFEL
jgi:hypothetical protein